VSSNTLSEGLRIRSFSMLVYTPRFLRMFYIFLKSLASDLSSFILYTILFKTLLISSILSLLFFEFKFIALLFSSSKRIVFTCISNLEGETI